MLRRGCATSLKEELSKDFALEEEGYFEGDVHFFM